MIRLLQLLIFGYSHEHKWKTIREVDVVSSDNDFARPIGRDYECRCEVCGKIKRFRV